MPTEPAPLPPDPFELLGRLVDPDDCEFDHNGGCQAHAFFADGPGQRCPHAEAKELLEQRAARQRARGVKLDRDDLASISITGAENDLTFPSAAAVAERLGLGGIEASAVSRVIATSIFEVFGAAILSKEWTDALGWHLVTLRPTATRA